MDLRHHLLSLDDDLVAAVLPLLPPIILANGLLHGPFRIRDHGVGLGGVELALVFLVAVHVLEADVPAEGLGGGLGGRFGESIQKV